MRRRWIKNIKILNKNKKIKEKEKDNLF